MHNRKRKKEQDAKLRNQLGCIDVEETKCDNNDINMVLCETCEEGMTSPPVANLRRCIKD